MNRMINFRHTLAPCVTNEVTLWHVAHGWIWDVIEVASGKSIGVFFCTHLCGDGCVCHFDTVGTVRPALLLAAFRKGLRMILPHCAVIYATIEAGNIALIRCAQRLGFQIVAGGGFIRDGREIMLLKYVGRNICRSKKLY